MTKQTPKKMTTKVMTQLIALTLIALPGLAHASSISHKCSSADASVQLNWGMAENYIEITKMDWKTGKTTKIRDEDGDLEMDYLETKEIANESRSSCHNGIAGSYSRNTSVSKVRITRRDGKPFGETIIGVTPDRMAIEKTLLCEKSYSNIMPCQK